MEPPVHIGPEPLTASMLAAAPLMDQKQLLGVASISSAPLCPLSKLKQLVYFCLLSFSAVIHRGATVSYDPCPSPKLGW